MVRIIAGTFRSRVIKTLEGQATRPTSDRLKETLFNLLQGKIQDATFLDCFAGSGNVGIEAVSRGASTVVLIESSGKACRVIRENLEALGLEESSDVELLNCAVDTGLKILHQAGRKFDIVFMDPPYREIAQYRRVFQRLRECELVTTDGIVIAEHSKHAAPQWESTGLERFREIRQGDSILSLLNIV